MLTKEAWNAFLKTLEEPPPNTVFVLATTEPQKVMATIVDRCQRFDFQRPSLEQIAEVIRRVSAAEKIEIDDGAVALISRSASGSFRDALGTLDQLVAFGGERGRRPTRWSSCSAPPTPSCSSTPPTPSPPRMPVPRSRRSSGSSRSGRDPGQFARDLIAHLRQLLVARATGEVPDSFTVTVAQPERLAGQAEAIDDAKLMGAIDALSGRGRGDARGRRSAADPRGRAAQGGARRAGLLARGSAAPHRVARGSVDGGRRPEPRPQQARQRDEPAQGREPKSSRPSGSREPAGAASPATASVPMFRSSPSRRRASLPRASRSSRSSSSGRRWSITCATPAPRCSPRSSTRRGRSAIDEERSVLRIGFPASAKFNKRKAESTANVERMTEALRLDRRRSGCGPSTS